jgi:hypothetical protein
MLIIEGALLERVIELLIIERLELGRAIIGIGITT